MKCRSVTARPCCCCAIVCCCRIARELCQLSLALTQFAHRGDAERLLYIYHQMVEYLCLLLQSCDAFASSYYMRKSPRSL
uniref:Secreted protein n=1 Tax=Trichogramma kaykai TaxID=54128 RepID=A0ABD2WFW6_9HYME